MDHDPVVHIVYIISFTAVEYLDVVLRTRHLGLGGGLHGVGEGLGAAVVRDGDGPVAPGGCLLDGGSRIGQGVHVGHIGVQMQLHPLVFGGVQPLGSLVGQDGDGVQHHFVIEAVDDGLAQHLDPGANLGGLHNGLALLQIPLPEVAVDSDGAGVVGDVKVHHNGVVPGQLLVIRAEDPAHHAHRPHIQGHVLDGNGLIHKGLAEDGFPAGGCGGRLGLVLLGGGLGDSG